MLILRNLEEELDSGAVEQFPAKRSVSMEDSLSLM